MSAVIISYIDIKLVMFKASVIYAYTACSVNVTNAMKILFVLH